MAGNALEIWEMSRFCERSVLWNGYIRKHNQRYGPSCQKVGAPQAPPAPPPARPLVKSVQLTSSRRTSRRCRRKCSRPSHWRRIRLPRAQASGPAGHTARWTPQAWRTWRERRAPHASSPARSSPRCHASHGLSPQTSTEGGRGGLGVTQPDCHASHGLSGRTSTERGERNVRCHATGLSRRSWFIRTDINRKGGEEGKVSRKRTVTPVTVYHHGHQLKGRGGRLDLTHVFRWVGLTEHVQ